MKGVIIFVLGFLLGVMVYRYYTRRRIKSQLYHYLPELLDRPIGPLFPAMRSLLAGIRSVLDRYQEMEKRFRSSLSQISGVLDALPWPIMIMNRDGELWFWNRATCEWFQAPPCEPQSDNPMYYWMVVDAPELQERLRHALDEYRPLRFNWMRLHPQGRRSVEVQAVPVPNLIPPSLAVLFFDRTEEERFQQYRTEMAELILHELRTPLTGIGTALELLNSDNPDTRREAKGILIRQIDRLQQFVERLDTLSRSERPQAAPPENLDLVPIIRQVIQDMEDVYRSRHIRIRAQLPNSAPLRGWPALLRVMISNLLDNACKYSREGDEIEVQLETSKTDLTFTVADRGPGIPEHEKTRIFQRFYRGEYSRRTGFSGTGLGLSLVKHVVEQHRGKVNCENRPDGGTIFRVTLPLDPETHPLPLNNASAPEAPPPS